MDRQIEKTASKYGTDQATTNMQYSRVFREKQSRRMFDQLQKIRGGMAKTYEELEAMHRDLLIGKIYQSTTSSASYMR
jgi:hypothetical protein